MSGDDMRLDHRYDSSASITGAQYMPNDILYNGKLHSDSSARLPFHNSVSRKEKTSIFSFLQRFRAKNKNLFEDVTSLPSSPRSTRVIRGPNCRWESVESVLSSATANSFAFIPPSQLRSVSKTPHLTTLRPQNRSPDVQPVAAKDSALFLRRKYNLLGSDASLYQHDEPNTKRALKKLHRNSVGNVENLRWERRHEQELFASFRRPVKPAELARRPKSEFDISAECNRTRKVYCHRPGKGRAPQPPEQASAKTPAKPGPSRKKRKAPSPPKVKKMEKNSESESDDKHEEQTKLENPKGTSECYKEEEGMMYNDSLKLERGHLRANNSSTIISGSVTTEVSTPVSPKPWYKRSTTRGHKKSSLKSSDKKKTCEQLLDEWMLEAGLPRSSSFYDERKFNFPSSVEPNSKRRSQISMLANISELDREAAEIVKKERRRELEAATSMNERFYDQSTAAGRNWDPFKSVDEATTSKRNTPRDLITILNAITNVTKITVNTSFFKENAERLVSRQTSTPEMKIRRANHTPEIAKKSKKLTITELEDFDDELKMKSANKKMAEKPLDPVIPEVKPKSAEKTKEPMKPVKPFSSWMCPQCTLENPSWKFICEACNKWRPYSVTKVGGRTTPLITPKEDIKLHAENSNRVSTAEGRDEISKISQNIRKQVHDILASGETARNNLSKLKVGEDYKRAATRTNENKQSQLDSFQHSAVVDKIDENIEEIRKARLVFFSKNCLNDLNLKMAEPTEKSPPMNVKGIAEKNKYYNEEDRKKLREILKELKDSLPKDGLIEVNRLDTSKRNLEGLGSRRAVNETDTEIKNENLENRKSNSRTGVDTAAKQTYNLTAKKMPLNSSLETEVKMWEMRSEKADEWEANIQEAKKNLKSLEKPSMSTTEVASSSKTNLEAFKKPDSHLQVKVDGTCEALPKQPLDLKHLSDPTNGNPNFKDNKSATSLAVNRLLKKLQTAIASGQHHEAANIARELARLKVNCNMTRQDTPDIVPSEHQPPTVTVNLHIQKDLIQQTPTILKLSPKITLNDLKMKVFKEQDIPVQQQRWTLNGKLAPNEGATLEQMSLGVPEISLTVGSTVRENIAFSFAAEDKPLFQENQPANTSGPGAEEKPVIQLTGTVMKILSSPTDSSHLEDTTRTGNPKSAENPKPEKPDSISKCKIESAVSKHEDNVIVNSEKSSDKNKAVSASKDAEADVKANLPELKTEASSSNSEWKCPRCTLINPGDVKNCAACDEHFDSQAPIVFLDEAGPSHRNNVNVALKLANYQELINMEMADIITNTTNFECSVCLSNYIPGEGVILKDCLHTFCRECLIQTVQHSSEAEVKCPFRDDDYSCDSALQEREIKALVSAEVYEQHLARSVAEAENKIQNTFHCKTVNCKGWCIFEDNVNEFHCPVCSKTNCLTCQVIHAGLNCKQYQEVINKDAETSVDANRTRMMLQEMLQKGEAMTCPTCQIIVMKKWGCDWLRCSMCKTEICWVTRGPRWGPKGKGDTTGGCQCGVKGVKCHPRCTYCH